MANFLIAFQKVRGYEGELIRHQDEEAGGELYEGISRRLNPSWEGWEVVDALKRAASNEGELRRTLEQNQRLRRYVRDFYKHHYWDRFWGDRLPNQEIAEQLLDESIFVGVRHSVGFLQESLNLLSQGQKESCALMMDGLFGPKTLEALEAFLKVDEASSLIKCMYLLQGMFHIENMRKIRRQDQPARDWLKKIIISKATKKPKPPSPPTNLQIEDYRE